MHSLQLALGEAQLVWTPPILKTSALTGAGLPELYQALERHRRYLDESQGWEAHRQERLRRLLRENVLEVLRARLWDERGERLLEEQARQVLSGERGPYRASRELAARQLKGLESPRGGTLPP